MLPFMYGKRLCYMEIEHGEGTGQAPPEGHHNAAGRGDVRDRGIGDPLVRVVDLARWRDGLHPLREPELLPGEVGQADAVQVPRLPQVFLAQDRDAHGAVEASAAAVGLGDLPRTDEPQGRVVDEAAPGFGCPSGHGMVHALPYPGRVRGRADDVRRPGGGGRGVLRRQAQEHVEHEARRVEGAGVGSRAEASRPWSRRRIARRARWRLA